MYAATQVRRYADTQMRAYGVVVSMFDFRRSDRGSHK